MSLTVDQSSQFGAPIDRSWDHLEAIASTLANLRGGGSLAHELIQNADDSAAATRLVFRFHADALIVEDDGGFRKCDNLYSKVCELESPDERCCDFHAFATLGSATKKYDPTTTGAFGIGFLSVYQVTDRPEIFSAGIHWVVDEENQRVLPCRKCSSPHIRTGARIRLPWAASDSWLRRKLGAEPVGVRQRKALLRSFLEAIPAAMPFLRRLECIDLYDGATLRARFTKQAEGDVVRIKGPRGDHDWIVFTESFDKHVQQLRDRNRQLRRRRAEVSVAVRAGVKVEGRLYATLPTQVPTEMPLHLNATFFPRIDRKGILLDAGVEADWNRAAIRAGAEILADRLETLSRRLGPVRFWELVMAASRLDRHHSHDVQALTPVWEAIEQAISRAEVMWTSSGQWELVDRTVLAPRDKKVSRLLGELGVPTVGAEIRAHVPRQRVGIRTVDLPRLVGALEAFGLESGCTVDELPRGLRDEAQRDALRQLLAQLYTKKAPDDDLRTRLRAIPVWQGADHRFWSFDDCYLADRGTASVFARMFDTPLVVWPRRGVVAEFGRLAGDELKTPIVLTTLASAESSRFDERSGLQVLKWLNAHVGELSDEQFDQLKAVAIIPTSRGALSANETVRAGGFRDHLGVTGVVRADVARDYGALLERLHVKRLSFRDYLRLHLPAALERYDELPTEGLVALIKECGSRRDEIETQPALVAQLKNLTWIPSQDDLMREPGDLYLASPAVAQVLGEGAPLVHAAITRRSVAADFLRRLGVADEPRPEDVVSRVQDVTTKPPGPQQRRDVLAILRYLTGRERLIEDPQSSLASLRTSRWLAAERDSHQWHRPGDLSRTQHRALFASVGRFIWLKPDDQKKLGKVLTAIGVRATPSAEQVVAHVRNLATGSSSPSEPILRWLDAHASDDAIGELATVRFLRGQDGGLHRPDGIFREQHPLAARLPVLDPSLKRHRHLLAELDVARRPNGRHALALLHELTAGKHPGDFADEAARSLIRACWQVMSLAAETPFDETDQTAIVLTDDGTLWPAQQAVRNDLTEAVEWLSAPARSHVVTDDLIRPALVHAGVAPLSERLTAEVANRERAVRDPFTEARVMARQPHIARIVVAERGDLRKLLRLAERLKVHALDALHIRYSLADIDGLVPGPAIERTAHYDPQTGELFVLTGLTESDWLDVASVVKGAVLPDRGPSAVLPLNLTLAADDEDEATALLTSFGFPKLSEASLREFQELLKQWEARSPEETEADTEVEPESEGDWTPEGDERGEETISEPGAPPGGQPRSGDGSQSRSHDRAERESESDRAQRGGHASGGSARGGDRERSSGYPGANGGAGAGRSAANRRLVTYVSIESDSDARNEESGKRSADGEAGVDLVMELLDEHLAGTGLIPKKMPDKNKGYDILVSDAAETPVRYIEVKATSAKWGARGVGLSRPQFDLASVQGDRYWLYVVEDLYEPEATIWWITDPAGQVRTFQYDHGWSQVADGHKSVGGAPRLSASPQPYQT